MSFKTSHSKWNIYSYTYTHSKLKTCLRKLQKNYLTSTSRTFTPTPNPIKALSPSARGTSSGDDGSKRGSIPYSNARNSHAIYMRDRLPPCLSTLCDAILRRSSRHGEHESLHDLEQVNDRLVVDWRAKSSLVSAPISR